MTDDDPLADWTRSRQSESVPNEFCQRVMAAIAAEPSRSSPGHSDPSQPESILPTEPQPAASLRRERIEQAGGLLLIVCSCVVAVIRLSSLVDLVVPSTEDRVITREFFDESEEVSHVAPDVT